MSAEDINWKLIAVFAFLVIISIYYIPNQESIKLVIKSLLEWENLNITIWLSVLISFTIHYLSVKNVKNNYEGLIYKSFGKFSDSAFASITYGLALTTSASILKGVYIQQIMDGEIYFNHFKETFL